MQPKSFSPLSLAAAVLGKLVLVGSAAILISNTPVLLAQSESAVQPEAVVSVPKLIRFSGTLLNGRGYPVTIPVNITFAIYPTASGEGEKPVWKEEQSITPNSEGGYSVLLGAASKDGLPTEVFESGGSQYLSVKVEDEPEQARVLLVSVPYALKSADAATLGGLPASAFLRADKRNTTAGEALSAPAAAVATGSTVTTTGGTAGALALFSGSTAIASSSIHDDGMGHVGVGVSANTDAALGVNGQTMLSGGAELLRNGNATATAGVNSFPLALSAQSYNSTTKTQVNPMFEFTAEPTGNNTAKPGATLNLLQASGNGSAPVESGLYFNQNGTIHFAPGQTFPGTGGGTINGVTAGTGLIGGGTTGNVSLAVDQTKVPLLNAGANSFSGAANFGGNLTTAGSISGVGGSLSGPVSTGALTSTGATLPPTYIPTPASFLQGGANSYPLDFHTEVYNGYAVLDEDFRLQAESNVDGYGNYFSSMNLLSGGPATAMQETGFSVAYNGVVSAKSIAAGSMKISRPGDNVNDPLLVIQADDSGVTRQAATQLVIQGSTITGQELLIGYLTDPNTNGNGGEATIQATWNGVANTGLALQPNGGCVCIRTGLDGAISYASDPLVVGQGTGLAVADGWGTYSSRRFKTDIRTLTGALAKVEKLRGVSYTLKANGKHEIGVIAEEVGEVVPEVVTYEKNGKDAEYVDYNRLTALLIEATKQQQAQIAQQGSQLSAALRQIKSQQVRIREQAASILALQSDVRTAGVTLSTVKEKPGLLAFRR